MMNVLEEVRQTALQAKSILITSQLDPDGDSVGSQLALRRILIKELGEDAAGRIEVINHVKCPERYSFVPDSELIKTPEMIAGKTFDLGFVLDGGLERTGSVQPLFEACNVRILVDHHKTTNSESYTHSLLDPMASATAQLIFDLIESPKWSIQLDQVIATQLFVGLVYDTGSFIYALTTPRAHRIAADLMEAGIDHSLISERILLETSKAGKRLLGEVLSNMEFTDDQQIAWCIVSPEMQESTGAIDDDIRSAINHLIFIRGVQVSLMFRLEEKDLVKVSLRSRAGFDVAEFAKFLDRNGGGHARAAGCTLKGPLNSVANSTIEQAKKALREMCVKA